ncbi:ferric reductase-like transmembrane domain-containing protein [Pseudonocardia sp. TRM90224]|uniref:ferric reductase-like transmembrane domain-containing protein n=1 Tax=Pseudonocardia sp. TRM90224 TaxID=2812678 RepID=UPI001E440A45|nr:ferric reductase-like transmembrane domain-containing protein [Pseudonocardia sp. TRM90224]
MTTGTARADALTPAALLIARLLPAAVVLLAAPLLLDVALGAPGAPAELHRRAPDVLGKAALGTLLASYAITPIATLSGWRWHIVLRRDYGLWTFAIAATDLVLAAVLDERGWQAGIAGSAGLAAGTMATLLLIPLALTSNRWSMRMLGRDWKRLHMLVLPVLLLVAVHLVFIGSDAFAIAFLSVVAVLWVLRLGAVTRWIGRVRAGRT